MSNWYLVHTKPHGEATAEVHLDRQGFDVYLPRLVSRVKQRGVRRERIVPLFPRYLFVRAQHDEHSLGPIRSTRGVTDIVRFGDRLAAVPNGLLDELKARADADTGLHHLAEPGLPLPGDQVEIEDGPFDGLQGVFVREAGQDRVIVLIDLLGSKARVRVPTESLMCEAGAL